MTTNTVMQVTVMQVLIDGTVQRTGRTGLDALFSYERIGAWLTSSACVLKNAACFCYFLCVLVLKRIGACGFDVLVLIKRIGAWLSK